MTEVFYRLPNGEPKSELMNNELVKEFLLQLKQDECRLQYMTYKGED